RGWRGGGGRGQDALHPGEGLADAAAGPAPERKIRELRPRGPGLWRESSGVEPEGIGEEARVAVRDVRGQDDEGAGQDREAAQVDVAQRLPSEPPGRRVEPPRPPEYALGGAQRGGVLRRGDAGGEPPPAAPRE